MARFRCVCGEVIVTSGPIPNPTEWRCTSDVDFDSFTGLVDAEEIYAQATIMYRCPVSNHLWVFWDGIDQVPTLYAPASSVTWHEEPGSGSPATPG